MNDPTRSNGDEFDEEELFYGNFDIEAFLESMQAGTVESLPWRHGGRKKRRRERRPAKAQRRDTDPKDWPDEGEA